MVLEGPDREFIEAGDGTQAFRIAVEQQPSLAILDWMMPGLDGVEVAHKIRTSPGITHIPIILVSAMGIAPDKAVLDALRIHAYVPKPMDFPQLKGFVDSALSR